VVAVTDYLTLVPDQIARFVPDRYTSLGTDGYGLSDTRVALRRHFEVDEAHITVAALRSLVADGCLEARVVAEAIADLGIDPGAPAPRVADPAG
jgi:pyruvate dehydrogenase E1 component